MAAIFPEDILKRICMNTAWISLQISLKFVPKGPINDIWALVRLVAWLPTGDKPLFEPILA